MIKEIETTYHTYSDELAEITNSALSKHSPWKVVSHPVDDKSLPTIGFVLVQYKNSTCALWEHLRKPGEFIWEPTRAFVADSNKENYRNVQLQTEHSRKYRRINEKEPVLYGPGPDRLIPVTDYHPGTWTKYFPQLEAGQPNLVPIFDYLHRHQLNIPIVSIQQLDGTHTTVNLRPHFNQDKQPENYLVELDRQKTASLLCRWAFMLAQPWFLERMLSSYENFLEQNQEELTLRKSRRKSGKSTTDLLWSIEYCQENIDRLKQDIELAYWTIDSGYLTPHRRPNN